LRNHASSGQAATIFPNPTQGDLWLSVNNTVKEPVAVTIWMHKGKVIASAAVNINAGDNLVNYRACTGAHQAVPCEKWYWPMAVLHKSTETEITHFFLQEQ